MGFLSLSLVSHTRFIRELTYPPLGLFVFWMYIFLGECSLCASWPLGSRLLDYIYALLSSGPFIFGMPGILSPVLVLVRTLVLDLGASQPLTLLIDLKWSHSYLYSICGGCWLPSLGLYIGCHPHGGGRGCVNIGSTPYFPFYVPSFTTLFPLGSFVMIIPPYLL